MSFLVATDLTVPLEGFALRGVSFDLLQGECLSIVGPSGAGKSVLLNAIAGLHEISRGTLEIGGEEISSLPPERRGLGIVYQDYALFPHLSVFDNIAFGLRVRERDARIVRKRTEEIAEAFGLLRYLDKRPDAISGGEQQRTALARALALRPRLLLMDEPFSALDPPMRRELRKTVRDWAARDGITIIQAAHDLDDVWAFADKLLVILSGAAAAFGNVNGVLGPPAPPFLRRAEGVRIVHGSLVERHGGVSMVEAGGIRLASTGTAEAGERVRLLFRPEDVTIHTAKPVGASARNVLESRVTDVHRSGDAVFVALRSGGVDFNAFLTPAAADTLSLTAGQSVFATIKAIHLNIG